MKAHMNDMIFAIDFDGTCVTHDYPKVGKDIGAAPVLRRIVDAGGKLILWTMRSDNRPDGTSPLSDAVNWFRENKIPLFGIQRNPDQDKWTSSPKAYAKIYIDDAALGCPLIYPEGEKPYVDWQTVESLLF